MKLVRVLSRLTLVSLAAAATVGLTGVYGGSVRPRLPNPQWQAERRHRPPAPQVSQFLEFVGEGMLLAVYAVAGRIVLRLRLSPVSPSEGKLILLDLHRGRQDSQSMRDSSSRGHREVTARKFSAGQAEPAIVRGHDTG